MVGKPFENGGLQVHEYTCCAEASTPPDATICRVTRDSHHGAEACPTAGDKCVTMKSSTGEGTVFGCSSHVEKAFGFNCGTSGNSVEFMGVEWQTMCCEGELCNSVARQTSILSLRHVHVVACYASKGGGAFALVSGGPKPSAGGISIADSTILECRAPLGGGAILALAMLSGVISQIEMTDSRMSNCSAAPRTGRPEDNAFGYGGALAFLSLEGHVGRVNLSGLDISYSNASGAAGAMMVYSEGRIASVKMKGSRIVSCNGTSGGGLVILGPVLGDVVLQGLVVLDCHATFTGFWDDDWSFDVSPSEPPFYHLFPTSGGLQVGVMQSAHVVLRDTVVARCSAWQNNGWGGGIMLGSMFGSNVERYTLDGVSVESCGATVAGAFFIIQWSGQVYIQNSVFKSNSAAYAGGMGVWFIQCVLGRNVSISSNYALGAGGGVSLYV